MALAPEQTGIGIRRHFTTEGVDPYDEVTWERRDARITNYRDGTVAFEQRDVEFPVGWSQNATNIVAQKYFRGTLGSPERERSLRQVIDRVVVHRHRLGPARRLLRRRGRGRRLPRRAQAPSSSTSGPPSTLPCGSTSASWGRRSRRRRASSSPSTTPMRSILNWYVEEGTIFKGGSGSGINLSNIRSSNEHLKGGGTASGPVSFMRGADASAGTIKSGGKTRRAAKMVILNADHPDVEDFIWCKAVEERKARVLRDNGFDMDLDGKDSHSTQYQNANNSVRVTDEFMQAVVDDADWHLRAVTTGEPVAHGQGPRPVPPDRRGGLGVRRPRHAVRHHHQPLAHRVQHRPHQRVQPLQRVHAPRQLGVQPGQPQPAQVPRRRRQLRRRGVPGRGARWCSPPRRSWSATPTTRPSASPRRPAASASSVSATPTSAPCSWPSVPALRLRRGTGVGRGHHRAHDGRGLRHVGPHRGPHGSVRRLRREQGADEPGPAACTATRSPPSTESLAPSPLLSAAAGGVGRRRRAGRDVWRAQLTGHGARSDWHHWIDDGL